MNLYFTPYIMSIIKAKTNFRDPCECKHTLFRPFKNETAFLQRPLTPFPPESESEPEGDENANEGDTTDIGEDENQEAMPPPPPPMQQPWVSPAGYFDPYFANMQQNMNTQIEGLATQMQNQMNLGFQTMGQNFQQHMNAGFQSFGQHIQNTMYQPIMSQLQYVQETLHSDIAALDARFDDLPYSE